MLVCLESRFKVQTKVIAADFTKADIYDVIGQELSGLDIGTLGDYGCYIYFFFIQNNFFNSYHWHYTQNLTAYFLLQIV